MTIRLSVILGLATSVLFAQTGCPASGPGESRPRSATKEQARPATEAPRTQTPPGAQPRRQAAPGNWLSGSHILISYSGASRSRVGITRTKAQAYQLAAQLLARLRKDPKQFAALAKKHSDGPTAKRGGFLGAWKRGRMVPAFEEAIGSIRIGALVGPVETPFGFHVVKRMPMPPWFAGRHILISYVGATRARPAVKRTKAQALAFATKLAKQLQKQPQQFAAMAQKHSNGPSRVRGGSLGTWRKGRMVPAFDTAIEKLKIGQVSGVVETKFGYHIIKRERPTPKKTP